MQSFKCTPYGALCTLRQSYHTGSDLPPHQRQSVIKGKSKSDGLPIDAAKCIVELSMEIILSQHWINEARWSMLVNVSISLTDLTAIPCLYIRSISSLQSPYCKFTSSTSCLETGQKLQRTSFITPVDLLMLRQLIPINCRRQCRLGFFELNSCQLSICGCCVSKSLSLFLKY